jgi:hypothetical protein
MLGNPSLSLAIGGSSTIGDSIGHIRFDVVGLKEKMDGGLHGMEDSKQGEKHTSNDLLNLTLSFDNLADSYTTNFQAIKDKLLALERSSNNLVTNGSS